MIATPHPPEQRTLEVLSSLSYRTGELGRYLQEVAQGVSELVGLDWSVVTFCREGTERILASTIDLGEEANQAYSLHGTLTGAVVETGTPLVVENTATCTTYGQPPEGYQAYLGVPLRTPVGEVIGTICSFQRQPRHFTEEEVRLAQIFAERAATAIDNYQLYQQQQRFNEALEAEVVKRTVELRATQAKLMELNNQLELRVEQRTAELQQANEQLQAEINERKAVERALRESEARFRALVEQAVDAFLVIDPEGRFLDANQRACDNLGYTRAELLSLSAPDVQKRLPGGNFSNLWQQLTPGCPVTLDGIHQRKDGSTFPVEVRIGLVELGGQSFALSLARDVTERKQAEAALRQSEEQLRQIAENLEQVFWMYSHDHQPIYISPAFEKVWGQPIDQWYADPDFWWKSIHPEDQERVYNAYYHGWSDRFDEEYRIVRPDGSVRMIRDQAFPIRDQNGTMYRIAGISEDITERRQSEQEMLKAMAALAEIGELAAMIVHELRNPLTTVLMGLNSFKRLDLPESSRERLELSLEEAERLQNLLKEILLYAKPQSFDRSNLELNQFIAGMLEPLRTMPSVMSRRLEFTPAPQPISIIGDRDKLKQVFINLIDNACEAVSEGETVAWTVEPNLDLHQVYIRVQNGGTPIPPEVLPKLTKPFYTSKTSGTGLGLAIVKRIVEAHSGELSITSSAAAGTVVSVRLPILMA